MAPRGSGEAVHGRMRSVLADRALCDRGFRYLVLFRDSRKLRE